MSSPSPKPGDIPQLSPQERRVLCEEIGSIGLTLGRALAFAGTYSIPLATGASRPDAVSPLERLRLLRALWPSLQAALAALTRQPDVTVQRRTRLTRLAQAGGDPRLANHLARTISGAAAWRRRDSGGAQENEAEARVPESRPHPTENTPANRLAVTLLEEWSREATTLAALADFCGEAEEAAGARRLAAGARRWREARCLADLDALTARERGFLARSGEAARSGPAYAVLFSLWRALHSPLRFDWTKCPLFCAPSLEPWRLYEIWCFLKVGEALRSLGWRALDGDVARCEPEGLRLSLTTGRASRLTFAPPPSHGDGTLQLFYQPLFVSANRDALDSGEEGHDDRTGFFSRSHAMQPDIALLWRDQLYLLDPKFRAYATPGDEQADIDKMHAYRDAIRSRIPGAGGVRAAWCLFPGEPGSEEGVAASPLPLVVAVRAYPAALPERLFGTAGIGALRLRPAGAGPAYLEKLLEMWLQ